MNCFVMIFGSLNGKSSDMADFCNLPIKVCRRRNVKKKMLQEGIARPHVMLLIIYVFAYIRSISWAAKPHFHAWNINIDFF